MRLRRQVRRLEEEALRLEWEAWLRALSPAECIVAVSMEEAGLLRLPVTGQAAARAQWVNATREQQEPEDDEPPVATLTSEECAWELARYWLYRLRSGELPRRFAHPNAEARLLAWVRRMTERPDVTLAELEACL